MRRSLISKKLAKCRYSKSVERAVADISVSLYLIDYSVRDMLKAPSKRTFGPASHREEYNDTRKRLDAEIIALAEIACAAQCTSQPSPPQTVSQAPKRRGRRRVSGEPKPSSS